jgi:hypothetical protein
LKIFARAALEQLLAIALVAADNKELLASKTSIGEEKWRFFTPETHIYPWILKRME